MKPSGSTKSFTARFFKSKSKAPDDLVRHTHEELELLLAKGGDKKVLEEVAESFERMKQVLYGEGDAEPVPEACAALTAEAAKIDFLRLAIQSIPALDFETRKDASQVLCNLMRQPVHQRFVCADYLGQHPDLIDALIRGYESPSTDIVLVSGSVLREVSRHPQLAKYLLSSPGFSKMFEYVELSSFEAASDAFATFKDLLTRHKPIVVEYLSQNYESFLDKYNQLLTSPNYLTRRQSVKLLGTMLIEPGSAAITQRYVDDPKNLRLVMTLLKDPGKSIQVEAFHVFKVFVANPNKTDPIIDMLSANQEKLLRFFAEFTSDKDDTQFDVEKAEVVKEIESLPPPLTRARRISSEDNLARRASGDARLERRISSDENMSRRGSAEGEGVPPSVQAGLQGLNVGSGSQEQK